MSKPDPAHPGPTTVAEAEQLAAAAAQHAATVREQYVNGDVETADVRAAEQAAADARLLVDRVARTTDRHAEHDRQTALDALADDVAALTAPDVAALAHAVHEATEKRDAAIAAWNDALTAATRRARTLDAPAAHDLAAGASGRVGFEVKGSRKPGTGAGLVVDGHAYRPADLTRPAASLVESPTPVDPTPLSPEQLVAEMAADYERKEQQREQRQRENREQIERQSVIDREAAARLR
ncbi:hypothetical protein [Actinomycetospora soli]|uniref:hypothetical protein n=1 Tax=Actinomycetospora soli TaxID=2893887 RepID=UPI001E488045|nr:hypothetical protein [Actinomycetospora soli]MCD2191647.1 hypothetical protein [Actinomycetospora soli]